MNEWTLLDFTFMSKAKWKNIGKMSIDIMYCPFTHKFSILDYGSHFKWDKMSHLTHLVKHQTYFQFQVGWWKKSYVYLQYVTWYKIYFMCLQCTHSPPNPMNLHHCGKICAMQTKKYLIVILYCFVFWVKLEVMLYMNPYLSGRTCMDGQKNIYITQPPPTYFDVDSKTWIKSHGAE
jgi:hypothetical protein